jgi:glycosyltransferase involved in cell wall biosynthesis
VSRTEANRRIASSGALASARLASLFSLARWRSRLAPSGGYREAVGRTVVQTLRSAHRRIRIGWQKALRAGHLSLPASIPEEIARKLERGPTGSYDILCLPVFDWSFRFQRPQHLMRQFARHDRRVFYVSHEFLLASPVSVGELEPNVFGIRLPADAGRNVLERTFSEKDAKIMADGVARLHAASKMKSAAIVIQHPFWTPIARMLKTRFGWPIVYDCMDDYAELYRQGGPLLDIERELLRSADLVVASSELLRRKTAAVARQVALVRNAGEFEHFAAVEPASPSDGDIVIGYYGAIAHWFDSRLVAGLAQRRPNWRFELIGNTFTADLRPLRNLPNIQLLGEIPYTDLPSNLARWHGCIIPFERNELTEATNPVKVYEMLAAGMPVVAVDLPELRPIAQAELIELADDAEGFACKLEKLLAARTPDTIAKRRAFARQNTWESRFEEMAAAIERVLGGSCDGRQP